MSINKQLEKLYIDHYEKALAIYKSVDFKMANPLLLKVDEEEYSKSDLKVMILGQETYGWFNKTTSDKDIKTLIDNHWKFIDEFEKSENTKEFGSVTVEQLMYEYDKYLKHDIRGKKGRTFWNNGFNWFAKKLETHYQDKKLYFIWNNVSKLGGIDETGVASQIKDFEHKHFHLLKNEVEILKPDIVIFLTGTNRDDDIRANFENVTFDLCGCSQFIFSGKNKYKIPSKIISTDLPNRTIRLYHPNCYDGYSHTKKIAFEMLIDGENLSLLCDKTNIEKLFWEELTLKIETNFQQKPTIQKNNNKVTVSFEFQGKKISIARDCNLFLRINDDWKYITLDGINHQNEKANDLINMKQGNESFYKLNDQATRDKIIDDIIKYIDK
ncbi:MAG: hypothetical protein KU38_08495 [Sulfurovum sp. FS08-3]|nr:MAG: hypothetical protein KU38_08495 [Sulfurovum sp. FS08-3]